MIELGWYWLVGLIVGFYSLGHMQGHMFATGFKKPWMALPYAALTGAAWPLATLAGIWLCAMDALEDR